VSCDRSGTCYARFRKYIDNAEPTDSIHIVMSASLIEKNHQNSRASQEIEICGVTETCVIGHGASLTSNEVKQSF
jgi:hypothetical protein